MTMTTVSSSRSNQTPDVIRSKSFSHGGGGVNAVHGGTGNNSSNHNDPNRNQPLHHTQQPQFHSTSQHHRKNPNQHNYQSQNPNNNIQSNLNYQRSHPIYPNTHNVPSPSQTQTRQDMMNELQSLNVELEHLSKEVAAPANRNNNNRDHLIHEYHSKNDRRYKLQQQLGINPNNNIKRSHPNNKNEQINAINNDDQSNIHNARLHHSKSANLGQLSPHLGNIDFADDALSDISFEDLNLDAFVNFPKDDGFEMPHDIPKTPTPPAINISTPPHLPANHGSKSVDVLGANRIPQSQAPLSPGLLQNNSSTTHTGHNNIHSQQPNFESQISAPPHLDIGHSYQQNNNNNKDNINKPPSKSRNEQPSFTKLRSAQGSSSASATTLKYNPKAAEFIPMARKQPQQQIITPIQQQISPLRQSVQSVQSVQPQVQVAQVTHVSQVAQTTQSPQSIQMQQTPQQSVQTQSSEQSQQNQILQLSQQLQQLQQFQQLQSLATGMGTPSIDISAILNHVNDLTQRLAVAEETIAQTKQLQQQQMEQQQTPTIIVPPGPILADIGNGTGNQSMASNISSGSSVKVQVNIVDTNNHFSNNNYNHYNTSQPSLNSQYGANSTGAIVFQRNSMGSSSLNRMGHKSSKGSKSVNFIQPSVKHSHSLGYGNSSIGSDGSIGSKPVTPKPVTFGKMTDETLQKHRRKAKLLKKKISMARKQIREIEGKLKTLKPHFETGNDFSNFLTVAMYESKFPNTIAMQKARDEIIQHRIHVLKEQIYKEEIERAEARLQNVNLEMQIIEINDKLSSMREDLEKEKHKNYLRAMEKHSPANFHKKAYAMIYPPENIIIQNLLRAQIEFYFSDYNLKRDKRLLDDICKNEKIGFLTLKKVQDLARVRQLCSHANQVVQALRHSKFLTITQDNQWVGRAGFQRPQEKAFPFRRTVFVFGLPLDCNDKYVKNMLAPFGKLSKIVFDHGPDTLDRLVSQKMFQSDKVYQFRYHKNNLLYSYHREKAIGGNEFYICSICDKKKSCDEGFYEASQFTSLVCLQCAAAEAEKNLQRVEQNQMTGQLKQRLIGIPQTKNLNKTKTCLSVFTSQRQASKCVYVRSRIAYKDCFCTHYHHYSKVKKEIALAIKPMEKNLRTIPPRRPHDLNSYIRSIAFPESRQKSIEKNNENAGLMDAVEFQKRRMEDEQKKRIEKERKQLQKQLKKNDDNNMMLKGGIGTTSAMVYPNYRRQVSINSKLKNTTFDHNTSRGTLSQSSIDTDVSSILSGNEDKLCNAVGLSKATLNKNRKSVTSTTTIDSIGSGNENNIDNYNKDVNITTNNNRKGKGNGNGISNDGIISANFPAPHGRATPSIAKSAAPAQTGPVFGGEGRVYFQVWGDQPTPTFFPAPGTPALRRAPTVTMTEAEEWEDSKHSSINQEELLDIKAKEREDDREMGKMANRANERLHATEEKVSTPDDIMNEFPSGDDDFEPDPDDKGMIDTFAKLRAAKISKKDNNNNDDDNENDNGDNNEAENTAGVDDYFDDSDDDDDDDEEDID